MKPLQISVTISKIKSSL